MDPPWMHLFRDSSPDATTVIEHSIQPQMLTHGPGDVFVVKAQEAGGTVKYRVHCEPNATLAVLRDMLQNDEDNMMSADDRFHQGDFRVGKSAEPHIKWRDILQDDVIGIIPKNLSPPDYSLSMTRMAKKFRDHTSSSPLSLPPATVPLHLLTRLGSAARIYGNFANERDGYNYDALWVYGGLVCRIWEKQEPGMVPFRRLHCPKYNAYIFLASDEATDRWVENEKATVEFAVGYVYRSDSPCPEGAVPLYCVHDAKIGHCLTISETEKDLCIRLGAKNMGIHCYVVPP